MVTLVNLRPTSSDNENETDVEGYSNEYEEDRVITYNEYSADANERLIDHRPAYEKITNYKAALQLDEKVFPIQVKCQALGPEDKIVGRYDSNPMLKSMIYEVDFHGVQVKDYATNVIGENVFS